MPDVDSTGMESIDKRESTHSIQSGSSSMNKARYILRML